MPAVQGATSVRLPDSVKARRVLIVDDTPGIRRLFAGILSRSGIQVLEADNGRVALDLALDRVPDAIVSDIEMPEMDGIELCRQVRANPATRHVVFLIVSAEAPRRVLSAVDAGCSAMLEKPCSPEVLLNTLERLLVHRPTS
jgi:CheY-like chemotaxis protein